MEKLLIIGAGIGQIPLLEKAKKRNIHVTVATIPGQYPCIEMADDIIYKDIYDRNGIVSEAVKRGITAVISDQNDLMNPTVAYVAEKLGLPGNKFDTVMKYCNKNLFRDVAELAGVPVPRHIAVDSVDVDFSEFNCPFPWIVKPADSQSSIGVKRVDSIDELYPALETALKKSPTHSAIVEEFFEGHEIVCEGFIDKGNYYNLSFADRKYFNIPELLIPSQTIFPSTVDKRLLDRVCQYESNLATLTKPDFAIVHSEYLINTSTEEIRIVESALRGGGVYISSDLIPMATGIDINEVLLNKAIGIDVDVDEVFSCKRECASAYICFYLPKGVITEIHGIEEVKSFPFVHRAYIDEFNIGQQTEPMTYKGNRKGPILVSAESREELEHNIAEIEKTLQINIKDFTGTVSGIVWR